VATMTLSGEIDPYASPALTLIPGGAATPLRRASTSIGAVKHVPKALLRDYAASQHKAELAEGATGRLDRMDLTTIIAIYMLAWIEEQVDAPQVLTLSGSPRDLAQLLGWERDIQGLHNALTEPAHGGNGRFSPYATFRATEDTDGIMRPPGRDEHWIIDVEPVEQADGFLQVPIWWLYEDRTDDPLADRSRRRRGLHRCPDCAAWCTADKPWRRGDRALLGALMIIERAEWKTWETPPLAATFLARRWGLPVPRVQEMLAAAEDRGYITGEGRRGGRAGGARKGPGFRARRRVTQRPTDPLGDRRPGAAYAAEGRCPDCDPARKSRTVGGKKPDSRAAKTPTVGKQKCGQ
jgi:hypothetical protein